MSIISGKVLTNYMMDGKIVNGLNIPTLPSMVTWEKVITKDIGLDWSLFKTVCLVRSTFTCVIRKIWYVP